MTRERGRWAVDSRTAGKQFVSTAESYSLRHLRKYRLLRRKNLIGWHVENWEKDKGVRSTTSESKSWRRNNSCFCRLLNPCSFSSDGALCWTLWVLISSNQIMLTYWVVCPEHMGSPSFKKWYNLLLGIILPLQRVANNLAKHSGSQRLLY